MYDTKRAEIWFKDETLVGWRGEAANQELWDVLKQALQITAKKPQWLTRSSRPVLVEVLLEEGPRYLEAAAVPGKGAAFAFRFAEGSVDVYRALRTRRAGRDGEVLFEASLVKKIDASFIPESGKIVLSFDGEDLLLRLVRILRQVL